MDKVRSREHAVNMFRLGNNALSAIRQFPVPVLAAINGFAYGGGVELALACDRRIASDKASIGLLQGRMNIPSVWGGGIDLCRILGPDRALQLLSDAERMSASQALKVGLVDSVASSDETFVEAIARNIDPILKQSTHVLRDHKALTSAVKMQDRAALDDLATARALESWLHEDHWIASASALASFDCNTNPTDR